MSWNNYDQVGEKKAKMKKQTKNGPVDFIFKYFQWHNNLDPGKTNITGG